MHRWDIWHSQFRIGEVADPNAEDSMGCRPLTFALANDAEHLVGRCGEDLEDEILKVKIMKWDWFRRFIPVGGNGENSMGQLDEESYDHILPYMTYA